MTVRFIALLILIATVALCQVALDRQVLRLDSNPMVLPVTLRAISINQDGEIVRLKGNVEIRRMGLILRADEADYKKATGEVEARGNVRVSPFPRTIAQIKREGSQ